MTTNKQSSEEKLLTRRQLAAFLTEHGYPTGHSTLAKYCSPAINTGPPAECWWGKRPMYRPSRALEWAQSRLRPSKDSMAAKTAPENGSQGSARVLQQSEREGAATAA
jgi:hypothetical protein